MVRPSHSKMKRKSKTWAANTLDFCLPILEIFVSRHSQLEDKEVKFKSENIAILAAYNEDPDKVLSIRKMLAKVGFDCIVIYNCEADSAARDILKGNGFLLRNNIGFDFGAYRDSMQIIEKPKNLILMNTSMYWDLNLLKEIIRVLSQRNAQNTVTYLVESFQGVWHGQSFFIHLKLDASHLNKLKTHFIMRTKNWRFKRSTVKQGEKALFKFFSAESSIHIDFVYSYESVVRKYLSLDEKSSEISVRRLLLNSVPLNPTQHLWPALKSLDFPGVKKSLMNQNPARLEKVPSINYH